MGIVRVSGPESNEIAKRILGRLPEVRRAEYSGFKNDQDEIIDTGIALLFKKPNSFTGEDVLELQAHGGPVVLDMLMKRVLELGARAARAGEFSERAFLNDKIDLAQAEAIADLIEASSVDAVKAAQKSLQGEFSRHIHELVEKLIFLRLQVEAALDFPEEEIDFLADSRLEAQLAEIEVILDRVFSSATQGQILRDGMTVVIAGAPNAGKSSLLNRLAGQESAIVTDIPGTTRDVLREHIQIDGMPLHIIDTAGLRESEDPVEQEGIKRAWKEIEQADRILLVTDSTLSEVDHMDIEKRITHGTGITRIMNKIDVSGQQKSIIEHDDHCEIKVSAKTGDGIELLREHLKDCIGYKKSTEGQFMARRRHIEALQKAQKNLHLARVNLVELKAGELMAEELRLAQQQLSEITGEFTSDDLLGRIFTSFCIGK